MNYHLLQIPNLKLKIKNSDIEINDCNQVSYEGWDSKVFPNVNFNIKEKIFDLYQIKQNKKFEILLIERLPPDDFYFTHAKLKGSGASRRSIPNIKEIYESLSKSFEVKLEYLENKSLKEQIELFANAKIF
jgi:hypothetical protein